MFRYFYPPFFSFFLNFSFFFEIVKSFEKKLPFYDLFAIYFSTFCWRYSFKDINLLIPIILFKVQIFYGWNLRLNVFRCVHESMTLRKLWNTVATIKHAIYIISLVLKLISPLYTCIRNVFLFYFFWLWIWTVIIIIFLHQKIRKIRTNISENKNYIITFQVNFLILQEEIEL